MSVHDITPRLGVAYDLFGNGKTAVKVSLGKYVQAAVTIGNPARRDHGGDAHLDRRRTATSSPTATC